jgi:hypothetical protein
VHKLCEVEADLVLTKRRRRRHGSMVVHMSHDGALVGGEEDG